MVYGAYRSCQKGSRLLPKSWLIRGRDAVGERVGVERRIVEWFPLPGAAEADLQVIVGAPGVVEDAAHAVAEVGINLRKSQWDNDLTTRCGLRVSHGVSEGLKSRYPLGLWEKHAETERSGRLDRSPLPRRRRRVRRRNA